MKTKRKQEALTVTRLINEVLISQLSIPLRQIVNDVSFSKYTGNKRPDLLISEFEYDGTNDLQYIENLVAYAEVKDNCSVNDKDWHDAIRQGIDKSKKLKLPYFIITNCKTSIFYNASTKKEISLNGNAIREFQTIDILRLIKNRLKKSPNLCNIKTNVDSISTISESIFNKKLWELATVYRGISFKNNQHKIDFTIGFVSLEFFEEKEKLENRRDDNKIYWSDCRGLKAEAVVANLSQYISRLESETSFKEFKDLMEIVKIAITGISGKPPLINNTDAERIFDIIDSMHPLHGCGFDLFGAVYEMFASNKEKKEFGEYFTRRHYTYIFSKLLLKDELYFNNDRKFKVLDLACGTGGFLTESFKVLVNNYQSTDTFSAKARNFLSKDCFYGIDVKEENISRTKLNMFLVGDGHTNMESANTLTKDFKDIRFDYIITNPPYGNGTIKANTSSISTIRTEIAFLCKVIELLNIGGKACVITPDGVLENPSFKAFRKDVMEKCNIDAVISLPKFAFAPYTKEKTYALYFTKKGINNTKPQKNPIWMYIIDNDGLANSDKRFPTKLRNNRNGWMHDEISGWVSTVGDEKVGLLESRWLIYDDSKELGTSWVDEKGNHVKMRKAGFLNANDALNDRYCSLLPEYYLRNELGKIQHLKFNSIDDFIKNTEKKIKEVPKKTFSPKIQKTVKFQAKNVSVSNVFRIFSGNSGLTEEYIYSMLQHEGDDEYKLLTGSIDTTNLKVVYTYTHPINKEKKIFTYKGEGIHIVRKGKAGHINYLPDGNYSLNDDAYLLCLKENIKYDISLKWVFYTQKHLFSEYASNSDNGTWNKSGFLKYALLDIPLREEQDLIVEKCDIIGRQKRYLKDIENEMKLFLDDFF